MSILREVGRELKRAEKIHKPIHSAHEGFGVITEEFIEFVLEVFKKHQDTQAMRKELIQLAAMAVRTIKDVIDTPNTNTQDKQEAIRERVFRKDTVFDHTKQSPF